MESDYSKLNKSVNASLKSNSLHEILKEIGEIGIDNLLDDGLLKDIPVISTMIGFAKTGLNFQNKILAKKLINFLIEIDKVPAKDRNQFITKIDNDTNYETKVGETIVMILDKANSFEKSRLHAKLLKASIDEIITYPEFLKLSNIINRAYIRTLYKLIEIQSNNHVDNSIYEELFNLNLVSLNLVGNVDNHSNSRNESLLSLFRVSNYPENTQFIKYDISTNGKNLIRILSN